MKTNGASTPNSNPYNAVSRSDIKSGTTGIYKDIIKQEKNPGFSTPVRGGGGNLKGIENFEKTLLPKKVLLIKKKSVITL